MGSHNNKTEYNSWIRLQMFIHWIVKTFKETIGYVPRYVYKENTFTIMKSQILLKKHLLKWVSKLVLNILLIILTFDFNICDCFKASSGCKCKYTHNLRKKICVNWGLEFFNKLKAQFLAKLDIKNYMLTSWMILMKPRGSINTRKFNSIFVSAARKYQSIIHM